MAYMLSANMDQGATDFQLEAAISKIYASVSLTCTPKVLYKGVYYRMIVNCVALNLSRGFERIVRRTLHIFIANQELETKQDAWSSNIENPEVQALLGWTLPNPVENALDNIAYYDELGVCSNRVANECGTGGLYLDWFTRQLTRLFSKSLQFWVNARERQLCKCCGY